MVMRNHYFDDLSKNILFLAGKWAWLAPKGLGPHDPTKKLAHWMDFLVQPLSQKRVFLNLGP